MPQEAQTDISYVISDLIARTRVLENKYSLFGERMLIINKNMIEEYKKLSNEIKSIDIELKEIKNDIQNVKEVLKKIIKEIETFARKENLKILEKYINFWNPMNFVTKEEVIKIIQNENNTNRPSIRNEEERVNKRQNKSKPSRARL